MASKKDRKKSTAKASAKHSETTAEQNLTAAGSESATDVKVAESPEMVATIEEAPLPEEGPASDIPSEWPIEAIHPESSDDSEGVTHGGVNASEASPDSVEAESNSAEVSATSVEAGSTVVDGATHLVTDRTQIIQVLEAVLFASPKAMTTLRLKNLLTHFNYDVSELPQILEEMMDSYQSRGFQLQKVAGAYQFRSHPEHAEVMQRLLEDKPVRLSQSALEVLSIVAYKQPVTRSDVDAVRGVDSGHLMKGLLEKNLVRTAGHAESAGRPLLYQTAPYFLEVFGLNSLDDLPSIDEFQRELNQLNENTPEGAEATLEGTILAPELGIMTDSSGLSAEPDRGSFDDVIEEVETPPDFGVEDRALES